MNEIAGLELALGEIPRSPDYVGYGPLGYGVYYLMASAPWPPITVEPGNTVRVFITFQHKGKECSPVLYCSMGSRFLSIFDEDPQLTRQKTLSLPRKDTWTTYNETIDITVPTSYTGYGWKDIYAKIMLDGQDMAISPEYDDCIQVARVVPEFQMVEITEYESLEEV